MGTMIQIKALIAEKCLAQFAKGASLSCPLQFTIRPTPLIMAVIKSGSEGTGSLLIAQP